MAWNEVRISNWKDFLDVIEQIKGHLDSTLPKYIYRGQSNSEWTLKPSLLRIGEKYNFDYNQFIGTERQLYREFRSNYHAYSNENISEDFFNDMRFAWTIMQHYSCPTRLLDWADSPYVALFFAVESDIDNDGSIFLYNSSKLDDINRKNGYIFSDLEPEKIIEDTNLNLLFPILSFYQNKRSTVQRGSYSVSTNILFDHYNLIENYFESVSGDSYCCKLIIPKDLKLEFLARLNTMNISARSLFPDLDGLGRSMKHVVDLRGYNNI